MARQARRKKPDDNPVKLGRPRRAGEAAAHVVCARVTDDERGAWMLAAGDSALGEWIRATCNAAARRHKQRTNA